MPRKKAQNTDPEGDSTPETGGVLRPMVPYGSFVEIMNGLNPNTDAMSLYIYRSKPKIDIKNSGRPHKYLEKLRETPADLRGHVKTNHGGGEYTMELNADNRNPSALARCVLDIPIAEADPILDPVELVRGSPDTEQLIARWQRDGKVFIDPNGQVRAAQPGAGGTVQQTQANTIADKVMDKALSNLLAPPPTSPMADMLAVMKEAREQAASSDNGMVVLLTKQLLASEQRSHDLMIRLLDGQKEQKAQGDPIATAIDVVERIGKLGPMGGGQHWAVDLAKELGKAAAPLLGTYFMMKGADPAALPAAANGAPQAAAASTVAAPAAAPQMPPHMQQAHALATRLLERLKAGVSGHDFANSVVDMMGEGFYDQLKTRGKEVLITSLRSFPDLTAQCDENAEKLSAFMDEFLAAFDDEEVPADATA